MPIYEFKCLSCGEEFEVFCKSKEEQKSVKCPKCQSVKIERLMSVAHSIVSDGSSGKPKVETHTCPSGTCANVELPGYSK